jgi:bifunctional non-homologous end joining protein LigD
MLPTRAEKAFDSPDYIFELKFDGVRMLAYCGNGGARLVNRRGRGRTDVYTEIAAELSGLKRDAVLDGEIVAKRADAPYSPGRRADAWIKIKNPRYKRP